MRDVSIIPHCHPSTTQHTHTHHHPYATLSIRSLWIKLNCNYDKLSSIMPCHPFALARSDVICFKLGNCYPFDYIPSFFRHAFSTRCDRRRLTNHRTDAYEWMNLINSFQWHFNLDRSTIVTTTFCLFLYSAAGVGSSNFNWWNWYFGNRIKYHTHCTWCKSSARQSSFGIRVDNLQVDKMFAKRMCVRARNTELLEIRVACCTCSALRMRSDQIISMPPSSS